MKKKISNFFDKSTNILLIIFVVFFFYTGKHNSLIAKAKAFWGTDEGLTVPNFKLNDRLTGKKINLEDYKGKVVLINFWATWCPPCRAEIPSLIELQNEYKEKEFTVIGISLDHNDPRPLNKFINEYKINYPIVLGNNNIANDYGGIDTVPTSFLIDKNGKLARKYVGYEPKIMFERKIKGLL